MKKSFLCLVAILNIGFVYLFTGCESHDEQESADLLESNLPVQTSCVNQLPAGDTASAICYQGTVYYGLDASCDPPEETAGAEYVGKTKAMEAEGTFISPQDELEFTGGGGMDVYVVMQNDTVQKFIIQLENPDIAPGYVALDSLTTQKPDYYDTDTE